jgi:hypothetical protein
MRYRVFSLALFLGVIAFAPPLAGAGRDGFRLSVVVDGCEASEFHHDGKIYVEALRGRDFTLRLTNPTGERIAVALSVDGRNVVDAKRTTAQGAAKWVLSPGQTVEIPGWQVSGETSRKFFFTETARSYAKWLGDTRNVGTIEAVFFREKRHWDPRPAVEGGVPQSAPEESRDSSSFRRDAPPAAAAAPEKREADRFAATGIGDRTDHPVRWIEFEEEPEPAARIAVRYEFRRELVRLGVLPRADEALASRERARGFEPRYAPDPDRRR